VLNFILQCIQSDIITASLLLNYSIISIRMESTVCAVCGFEVTRKSTSNTVS